jgi:hypothetical protein
MKHIIVDKGYSGHGAPQLYQMRVYVSKQNSA